MEIIYKDPNILKDYSNNPRNNEKAIDPVMESIKQFGFLVPVLIDEDDVIIAGHTRKEAAIKLELQQIPCIYVKNLTPEQVKAFRLVDNKTTEFSTWDYSKLAEELNELVDIDLESFCFPNLEEDLLVTDEDFLLEQDGKKEQKAKIIVCPDCGRKIEI